MVEPKTKVKVEDLSISYGNTSALRNASFEVKEHEIFGIIGPANSGKTSFLRALNRMDEFMPSMRIGGQVLFDGRDVATWRNVYRFVLECFFILFLVLILTESYLIG